jgi:hypothetical protein
MKLGLQHFLRLAAEIGAAPPISQIEYATAGRNPQATGE